MNAFDDSHAHRLRGEYSSAAEVPGAGALPADVPNPDPPKQIEELTATPGGASVVAVPANTTNVTAQSHQPIMVALVRGVALAAVVAAVNFFTSLQLGYSVRDCAVSAALIFFVTLQGRGVIEGAFDQAKAARV